MDVVAGVEALPSWAGDDGDLGEGQRTTEEWLELIQQLLVAGGYFRARIPTLKPFDKVVGGLAWSINASYATEVDFDLFLREDNKIGEKIQLSEKIEKALQRMKCPHTLQAHQMEGLDYPYIFPVVQWLLTRVLDARAQFGNQLRQYAQYACESKHGYAVSGDDRSGAGIEVDANLRKTLEDAYGVSRQLRRKKRPTTMDELERRLNWTLMEYGHKNLLVKDMAEAGGQSASPEKGGTRRQSLRQSSVGSTPLEEDFSHLGVNEGEDDGTVSGSRAAQIVGQRLGEIQRATSEYASSENQSLAASHMQQREDLKNHIERAAAAKARAEEATMAAESDLEDVRAERDKGKMVVSKLSGELDQMKALRAQPGYAAALERALPAVKRKQDLVREREAFQSTCEGERERLKAEAAEATAAAEKSNGADAGDQALVAEYQAVSSQTQGLQQDLSKVSRAALFLRRALDDIPSTYELTQYQKRFVELYDLVQANLQETRQHYNTYNTLSDTKEFLQKESKLMTSIYNAAKTTHGASAFLDQMREIARGVASTMERYRAKQERGEEALEAEKGRLGAQLGLQREYLKALADLQAELRGREEDGGS